MKRYLPSVVIAILCSTLAFNTIGCSGQQTAAELIATVGTAVAALETLEGNTANVAKIQADTQAAETAIANWKTGTPAQDVLQVLSILQSDLSLLPIGAQDQALIQLALGTVEQIIMLFPNSTPAVSAVRQVHLTVTVHNKGDFRKQWNSIIAANPALAGAAIK
jgi:hypothetical protein